MLATERSPESSAEIIGWHLLSSAPPQASLPWKRALTGLQVSSIWAPPPETNQHQRRCTCPSGWSASPPFGALPVWEAWCQSKHWPCKAPGSRRMTVSSPDFYQSLATWKIRLHRPRSKLRAALGEGCSFSRDDRGVQVCRSEAPRRDQDTN